jgi:hypothetical protein
MNLGADTTKIIARIREELGSGDGLGPAGALAEFGAP